MVLGRREGLTGISHRQKRVKQKAAVSGRVRAAMLLLVMIVGRRSTNETLGLGDGNRPVRQGSTTTFSLHSPYVVPTEGSRLILTSPCCVIRKPGLGFQHI